MSRGTPGSFVLFPVMPEVPKAELELNIATARIKTFILLHKLNCLYALCCLFLKIILGGNIALDKLCLMRTP